MIVNEFFFPSFFPAMTKIVGTLGPKCHSVVTISSCLKAGMSVARFDFSSGGVEFHQESLDSLKIAMRTTNKLYAGDLRQLLQEKGQLHARTAVKFALDIARSPQPNLKLCGFFICRMMRDIVESGVRAIPESYLPGSSDSYSQEQIDEVIDEWLGHLDPYLQLAV